jgi:hypothetical protein
MEFHPSLFEGYSTRTLKDTELSLFQKGEWTDPNVTDKISYVNTVNLNMTDPDDTISSYKLKNHEETLLTTLFFSSYNIQNIQNLIKFLVHKETGYVLDSQSKSELIIVMRSVYLEYANELSETAPKDKFTKEVARLNDIVINLIVPKIISQVQQYLDYLRDSNSTYQIDLPKFNSISGEREYRSPTQIFFGGDF